MITSVTENSFHKKDSQQKKEIDFYIQTIKGRSKEKEDTFSFKVGLILLTSNDSLIMIFLSFLAELILAVQKKNQNWRAEIFADF